jgi:hypothetical protein
MVANGHLGQILVVAKDDLDRSIGAEPDRVVEKLADRALYARGIPSARKPRRRGQVDVDGHLRALAGHAHAMLGDRHEIARLRYEHDSPGSCLHRLAHATHETAERAA